MPNRDGVEFFLRHIWPNVRTGGASHFEIVGRTSPSDQRRFADVAGVTWAGYVEDVRGHFAAASCTVVPLRIGGGTRLKILDAWAMGTAVVSTSVGCEGLKVVDGENILIRDDPAEFAAAVRAVLGDATLRQTLQKRGRETAERWYSWTRIGHTLREEYRRLSSVP